MQVGWLVFNGTFSTKRLHRAIGEQCVKTVVTGWSWWGWTTKTVKKKQKDNEKNQNSSCELFCLKVNGSWSNWSSWRLTPRHKHHLDIVRLANYLKNSTNKPNLRQHKKKQHTQKKKTTLVDTAGNGVAYSIQAPEPHRPSYRLAHSPFPVASSKPIPYTYRAMWSVLLSHISQWQCCRLFKVVSYSM